MIDERISPVSTGTVDFRPAAALRTMSSPSDGSKIGDSPACRRAIFAASTSAHTTALPSSAKHVPVTRPTYPEPTIVSRFTVALPG
jgi:hypothetical protein